MYDLKELGRGHKRLSEAISDEFFCANESVNRHELMLLYARQ